MSERMTTDEHLPELRLFNEKTGHGQVTKELCGADPCMLAVSILYLCGARCVLLG